jgi:hypothetical protein
MNTNVLRSVALTLAFSATGSALATQVSFNQSTCLATSTASCSVKVNNVKYGANLSGWSASSTGNFAAASMVYYAGGGVGITTKNESTASPQHAMDNNGSTEALLINFGELSVALNQISIGWSYSDADVSILRYTGVDAPKLSASTVSNLDAAAGWEWVGDYSTLKPSSPLNFNTGNDAKTASWWLVSAYNSAYSGKPAAGNLTNGNDYFKLSGFAGNVVVTPPPVNQVPEPGSFALLGIAMLGFASARSRSKTK